MEIKRYSLTYFLLREMRKDLLVIDTNNSAEEDSLFTEFTNFKLSSECKKINYNKWKKIN